MNTDGLKKLWKTVFGDPDSFIETFFDVAFSPDRCKCIEQAGDPICALYWLDCEYAGGRLAYIYAVATHPDHRGKGLASRLLRNTHDHLKAQGYAGAVLKPAPGLFPFYERLGYVTSGFVSFFEASAQAEPAGIRQLSAAEHARFRQQLLPEDGVRQGGITLDFFHRFADVYAAEDALVCIDSTERVVLEYLGNPQRAPGILTALGIEHAKIRTFGSEIPFTMYHPLNCTKIPGYLGITLE